jgi:glutamate dehydrogenase (NADP+)
MNAIELKQVSFSYDGKTKILENTDFTAEYGEVTLLSGHSGEGKSTLMYIVSGIIPNVNYGELTGEVKIAGEDIKGKTIAAAGFGNVTWGICKKAKELGAKVITLSGPDGYVYDPDGVSTDEKVEYLLEMRASGRNVVKDYADKFGVQFFPGEKPWGVKADIIMPSAMQNDVNMEQAKKIAECGAKYYIEVANMPTTNDALAFLMGQKHLIVAPSKAVNAGGVGVSAMEMSQNSERLSWTVEEVDGQLKKMMETIHRVSAEAAEEYGLGYNLVAGANIAGFKKVAEAMMEQGIF